MTISPLVVVLLALTVYAAAYRFYARYLATRLFELDEARRTPAHPLRDDVDYVPANRYVLFGHQYASITGLSPMLGPAIAVIWGWMPATLWVVFGAIFVGAVHDFGALAIGIGMYRRQWGLVPLTVFGFVAMFLWSRLEFGIR